MQACIGNKKLHWKQSYELGYTKISPRFPKFFCPGRVRKLRLVLVRIGPFSYTFGPGPNRSVFLHIWSWSKLVLDFQNFRGPGAVLATSHFCSIPGYDIGDNERTGGMVRWLKKSSKDVNDTWQTLHLKSRWLRIRTIHFSFIFSSKYGSRVFLPKWLTFFSSKKPRWLKIRREIEFEAKWFEFWAISVFSS